MNLRSDLRPNWVPGSQTDYPFKFVLDAMNSLEESTSTEYTSHLDS